jgi:hypothetical protein
MMIEKAGHYPHSRDGTKGQAIAKPGEKKIGAGALREQTRKMPQPITKELT